jgi:RNA polymerase sigma-70 factor (TIGR02957 family)
MTEPFARHRSLLFTIAYEILGSAADAEDVVQETWLRWAATDRTDVRDSRAFLVRIVSRQALNRLRSSARRKEEYVGEWLPEPVRTSPELADDVELAESVSLAMLTVLETLGHTERAVFVLREVFDVSYDEIAATLGKSASAVRQIAHRAREHVAARRPRMQVNRAEQEAVVERFLKALNSGDLQGLLDVLAPDATMIADGGGVVEAVQVPIVSAQRIARLLSRFSARVPGGIATPMSLNGAPACRVEINGVLDTAIGLVIVDGRITRIYAIRNPHKLNWLGDDVPLSRQVTS